MPDPQPPTAAPLAAALEALSQQARQFHAYACDHIEPQPELPCNRRDFYKISFFTKGRSRLHQAARSWVVEAPALVLCSLQLTYTWEAAEVHAGEFCGFTEAFIAGPEHTGSLHSSPLFTLGADPVLALSAEQAVVFSGVFQQLLRGLSSSYPHKYEVLRHHVHLLLHYAQQLRPTPPDARPVEAASRLAARFLELLEQQFPLNTPALPLRLRSAQDFAPVLGVHVNHLNRAVRKATGKTTTEHLTARLVQEAQALLVYTDWPITDIAHALGFDYPTYFHNFFKKHTGRTPGQVRATGEVV